MSTDTLTLHCHTANGSGSDTDCQTPLLRGVAVAVTAALAAPKQLGKLPSTSLLRLNRNKVGGEGG